MKQILIILSLSLMLISCRSVNKSLVKTNDKEKTDLQAQTTGTASSASSTSTNATYTTTREFEDSAKFYAPAIMGSVSAENVTHGQVAHIETPTGAIDVKIDPATGAITATATPLPQKVPIKGKETTIGSVNTISMASTASGSVQSISLKTEKEIATEDKTVKRSSNTLLWVIIGHVITAGIVFIIWWYRRKKKRAKPG